MTPNTALQLTGIDGCQVTLMPALIAARDAAVKAANEITCITDIAGRGIALERLRELKGLAGSAETDRRKVKAPVLALSKTIDALADSFTLPISEAGKRLEELIVVFDRGQRAVAHEAEAARIAEVQRLQAERDRLTAEARQKDARLEAAMHKVEVAVTVAEGLAAIRASLAAEADAEEARQAAKDATLGLLAAQTAPTLPPPTTSGLRREWDFECVDVAALYRARPEWVILTPNRAAILQAIRQGLRDCPGLNITEKYSVRVRRAPAEESIFPISVKRL
jgi:hypothetical protein